MQDVGELLGSGGYYEPGSLAASLFVVRRCVGGDLQIQSSTKHQSARSVPW